MQGSWQEAIRNRFKILRKLKRPTSVAPKLVKQSHRNWEKKTVQSDVAAMPDGETTETCIEHIGNMKR